MNSSATCLAIRAPSSAEKSSMVRSLTTSLHFTSPISARLRWMVSITRLRVSDESDEISGRVHFGWASGCSAMACLLGGW